MGRRFELPEPRHSHVGNVIELRPRINPRHPSLQPVQTTMFDQDDPEVHAADRCVVLTEIEAQSIAGVLRHARGHCPSPGALDEALELLAMASGRITRGDAS
jgi:hypothetical protein